MEQYLIKKLSLAQLPTPIEKLDNFSKQIGGLEIYMKRDDLTGMELSGNKVRKLDYILYDAVQKNVDVMISCGDVQSNHLRTCAAAAVKIGIKPHLVVWGEKPDKQTGNYFMDCLMGADFTYYDAESIEDMNGKMEEIACEYREQGKNPLVIPLGANIPLGVLGYFNAVRELKEQLDNLKMIPDYIVVTVGTGSTYLGLMLGLQYYDLPIELIGVNVIDKEYDYFTSLSEGFQDFSKSFHYDVAFHPEDIHILSDYVGVGYGIQQNEVLKVITELAQTQGIFLDNVYTGKAMYGLMQEVVLGNIDKNAKVLFWNTGGIFELFN